MKTRVIKFRAWDKVKNTWIFKSNITPFSIIGEITVFGMLNQYSIDKLDDIIILHFTGLNDKSGQPIYEGDIVNHIDSADKCEIIFQNEIAMFLAQEIGDEKIGFNIDGTSEVIGNIYETPDLLNTPDL